MNTSLSICTFIQLGLYKTVIRYAGLKIIQLVLFGVLLSSIYFAILNSFFTLICLIPFLLFMGHLPRLVWQEVVYLFMA